MIVSVTFRHHAENKRLCPGVNPECQSVIENVPAVTSSQVVFSKQALQAKTANLISCSISVYAQNNQPIHSDLHQGNEFDQAGKAVVALSRLRNSCSGHFTAEQRNWS